METESYLQGHPMMAQPVMQQGELLGKNIIRLIRKQPLEAFEYNDKGSMATIGRNKAVVDLPKYHFSGVFAWFVWMFVHLISLIGFKNKALVFLSWVYNYIRFDREARLIIRPYKKKVLRRSRVMKSNGLKFSDFVIIHHQIHKFAVSFHAVFLLI